MPPQSEKSTPESIATTHPGRPPEFSAAERKQLLHLAHQSIEAALQSRELRLKSPSAHFSEPRGVFTTLYLHYQLRGCVGYVFPVMPLCQAVAETAHAAAFNDQRFSPVTAQEASELCVSLSVLSSLQPVTAEGIEVGTHGLVVSMHGHRGLLLPQVPVEHGWDRETFLAQTCLKAGLAPNAWKKEAKIEVFTAEVFGEIGHQ